MYKSTKGALQFPVGQPLPLDLISRITQFRATREMREKAAAKAGKKKA